MADLKCLPAQNITTQEADMRGSGDFIPVNRFLRIDYTFTAGGPYTNIGTLQAGTNSDEQVITQNASGLSEAAVYYYVVREIDTDGTTILDTSEECSFTTGRYNPRCRFISGDDDSVMIEVCADWVNTDQQLQVIYSTTSGGPYNIVGGSVAGTYQVAQCQIFDIPLTPCDAIYTKARVTPVPAQYVVDWEYAHMNRSGVDETVELGLGSQADWLAAGGEVGSAGFNGLTIVDTHVATGASQGTWTLRSGTDFAVPTGVTQLHLGFRGSGGNNPANGNWLDSCSIILRQVFPGSFTVGEQLVNGSFEVPVKQIPTDWEYIPESTPGIAWQTSDVVGIQNPANPGAWGGPVINGPIEYFNQAAAGFAPHTGTQFAELNAETPSELYQVVPLAVGVADSILECPAAVFNVECTMATPECLAAVISGTFCGLVSNYWYAFQYATSPTGPWVNQTTLRQVFSISEPPVPFSESITSLSPDTQYWFRVVVYDETQSDIIGVSSPLCTFTTDNCVFYCGMAFDPDDCELIDPGNGDPPYFYCIDF